MRIWKNAGFTFDKPELVDQSKILNSCPNNAVSKQPALLGLSLDKVDNHLELDEGQQMERKEIIIRQLED